MSQHIEMSHGQNLLHQYLLLLFPDKPFVNYRPRFLRGLEYDFYYPELKVALEFNGDQHYIFTEKYGNPKDQIRRDKIKKELSNTAKVRLIIIDAVDLTYSRIIGLIHVKTKELKEFQKSNKRFLRKLDRESNDYRRTLLKLFPDSVTVHRKDRSTRSLKQRRVNKNFTKESVQL